MKLEDVRDPKLRARIEQALQATLSLKADVSREIPLPKVGKKRIRQDPKPLMNKLEQEYYHFGGLSNLTSPVSIQGIRFKLANGIWYKPDFFLWFPNKPAAIEVKGKHAFRGGFENLKIAAHQYPWIQWLLVWKHNDVWQRQEVIP